jgi:hypothetical protein
VADVLSTCASEKQATAGLEAADKILSAYFSALQQASTASNFSVDAGIAELSSSVDSIPQMNATQAQALGGLASFLASAATQTLEQRTIKFLISGGASKAEAAIGVMEDFVVPQLTNAFAREKSQTLATFTSYIQQSGSEVDLRQADCASGLTARSFQTGTSYLLGLAYCARLTALSTKMSALESYKSSLEAAKAALKNLETGKDNLSAKDLARQLISQASSLKNDVDKIRKAF